MIEKHSKIYIAGHRGLVGNAIYRLLQQQGYTNLIIKTHKELDLCNQQSTCMFFEKEKPEYVFLAAAKVGGILANNIYRADFIYKNIMIQSNVIEQCYRVGVKKLLLLGSTCIYPKQTLQPIKEEYLLTAPLEYTNEPYAIAKIAGIKMSESYNIQYGTNFVTAMPTNLYGPQDNFDFKNSHVLPALLRKIYLAYLLRQNQWDSIQKNLGVANKKKAQELLASIGVHDNTVEIWGSGKPRRDLLYIDDMASACIHIMKHIDFSSVVNTMQISNSKEIRNTHLNIGSGIDYSITELAELIKAKIGYKGKFSYDTTKPDGTFIKFSDIEKIKKFGWSPTTNIEDGIIATYEWYKKYTMSC